MGKTNMGYAAQKRDEVAEKASGDFFKAAVGENQIRILPPWGEAEWPFLEVEEHKVQVGDRENTFTCPLSAGESFCYICDLVVPSLRHGSEDEQQIATNLAPGLRVYANIIDRKHPEKGVLIWNFSYYRMYKDILAYFNDPDYGDITDINKGTDLVLTRTGEGRETRYSVIAKRNPSAVDPEILRGLHSLSDIFAPVKLEDVQKMVYSAYNLTFEVPDNAGEPTQSVPATVPAPSPARAPVASYTPAPISAPTPVASAPPVAATNAGQVAIVLPDDLAGPKRKISLAKAIAVSPCFGRLLDENSEVCAVCAAIIDCASAMAQAMPQAPAPVAAPAPAVAPPRPPVAPPRPRGPVRR